MPPNIQASLLSATMAPEILDLTSRFMRDALRILVMRMVDVKGTRQVYVAIQKEERKLDTLGNLYEMLTIVQAIIYCNTCRKADFLAGQMGSATPRSPRCMPSWIRKSATSS